MKVKIIKSFWQGEVHAEKGDIIYVGSNLGHGLIEAGLAYKVSDNMKEMSAPPKDKMFKQNRGKKKIIIK